VPRASGVLSALGLAISDLRRDYVSPRLGALDAVEAGDLEEGYRELERLARGALEDPEIVRRADLRYRRQAFELTVDAGELNSLGERFHAAHEQRYGYAMPEEPVELVTLRVVATVAVPKPELREPAAEAAASASARRRVNVDGSWQEVDVLAREGLGSGSEVAGPCLLEFAEATCFVRPGWSGAIDAAGTLVLERS